jgi:hypothetical protein
MGDNIYSNLREIGYEALDWIQLSQDWNLLGSIVPPVYIKIWETSTPDE